MGPRTQGVPGYYVWAVPGNTVAVHLRLEVVDRLAAEFLRGLGAVPKRGAEVGGVLLGSIEPGLVKETSIVRIEDFEPVPAATSAGRLICLPKKIADFDEVCSDESVGYYRSHTREDCRWGRNRPRLRAERCAAGQTLADKPGVADSFSKQRVSGKTRSNSRSGVGDDGEEPPSADACKTCPEIAPPPPQQVVEPRLDVPPRPKSRSWNMDGRRFRLSAAGRPVGLPGLPYHDASESL
jgi:hypothetical protein